MATWKGQLCLSGRRGRVWAAATGKVEAGLVRPLANQIVQTLLPQATAVSHDPLNSAQFPYGRSAARLGGQFVELQAMLERG